MSERRPEGFSDEDGEPDDPVYEAAALWVARLTSADAAEEDRRAFEEWRSADPAHAEAFAEMEEWRRAMGRTPDPRVAKRRTPKGLAAIAAIGLAGALAYQHGAFDRLRSDAWTSVGEIERLTLADGSRADLNTDTAIRLHFTPIERTVELLRGEAAFDVVPDPARPFVVRGAGVSARAVGTRFFVRVGAEEPVGVEEGRVGVTTDAGAVEIGAGEIAALGEGGRPSAAKRDVARSMAWRDGLLRVSGEPLADVLAELDRYRSGRIFALDAGLGARRFSGTLDLRDTDAALSVLAAGMGLRITRVTPLLVLIRPAG